VPYPYIPFIVVGAGAQGAVSFPAGNLSTLPNAFGEFWGKKILITC